MTGLRIAVLGGFAVTGEAAPPPVRGTIPQALLARLALAEGSPLPADTLLAELWSDPGPDIVSSLRAHVSRLRSRGWGDRLSGGREGYRLDLTGAEVDLLEFERLLAADPSLDPAARRDAIDAAVRLWRPDPLAWARAFPFSGPVSDRVARLHRSAVLERARLDLDVGDAADAVADLRALLETARAGRPAVRDHEVELLLVRALARDGRAPEALRQLDELLVELEPGPSREEAESLRAAVLAHDPALSGGLLERPEGTVERVGMPRVETAFVGRGEQLDALHRARGTARLITLTGAAGAGKTRLALEAVWGADADDEVQWFVDLTQAAGPDDVLGLVATSVGAVDRTLPDVVRVVGGRRGLLLLDNAEHVLGAVAALCSSLLGDCAGLTVLVTSRETLRLPGERVIGVPPLLGDDLADAVELFRTRAFAGTADREWSSADTAAVERLCASLDGLPLAIELAASRADALSLDDLAASVTESAPSPEHPQRHASIDTAIEWSIRLVSDEERALLSQLRLFPASFTLEMVGAICVVPGSDSRHVAAALARRSLLVVLPVAGGRRFRMLQSVAQYVSRELPAPDEEAWSARHAEWCVGMAWREAARLASADAASARAAVRRSRPDLDRALAWTVARGDRAAAVALVGALGQFWVQQGFTDDALGALDEVLSLPGSASADHESAALRAAATIAAVSGEPWRVGGYISRLRQSAAGAEDPSYRVIATVMAAYLAAATGDRTGMDELLAEAEAHAAQGMSDRVEAEYLVIRGDVLRAAGRPAQALETLGRAYRLASEIGHGWARGSASFITGRTLIDVGRVEQALPILRSAVIRFLESDDAPFALSAAEDFAVGLVRAGRVERAAEVFGAIEGCGDRLGYRGDAVDPEFTSRARTEGEAALPPGRWSALVERGRTRSLKWLVEHLVA